MKKARCATTACPISSIARGEEKIPLLLHVRSFDELSDSAFSLRTDAQEKLDDDTLHDGSQAAKVIQGYFDHFKGEVSVRVDPSMVLKHNAKSATTETDGMLKLEWSLTMPMKDGVELLITLDPRDVSAFKLMNSPHGSNCKDLIDTDCKCGPFTFANTKGETMTNMPYEIEGPQGVQSGCTDAARKTTAVVSPVTGPCIVRLLTGAEDTHCTVAAPATKKR